MQVVYALEPIPDRLAKSIFLEGPTPRLGRRAKTPPPPSWRPEAIDILADLGYDGVVFVPEPRSGDWHRNYDGQVIWEQETRFAADVKAMWLDRNLRNMPGFTSNVEFGEDYKDGRFAYGRPRAAPKCKYLDILYRQATGADPEGSLRATLERAVAMIGDGSPRVGGETRVPINVWRTQAFQRWLKAHKAVGNRLDNARVLHTTTLPATGEVFSYAIWVKVWVAGEGRWKENEWVFARTDTTAVVPIHGDLGGDPTALDVVLVREFRSPVRHELGMVVEFPGGSSPDDKPPIDVAAEEVWEETGLRIDPARLVPLGSRQVAATLSSHHVAAFALHLTDAEIAHARACAAAGTVLGKAEDSERTTLLVSSIGRLAQTGMDWAGVGMATLAVAALRAAEASGQASTPKAALTSVR